MYIIGYPLQALVEIAHSILFIYTIVILANVVLSWVNPDPYNPIVRIITSLTNPAFQFVRNQMRRLGLGNFIQIGMIDLAPLILLLLIMFIQRGILPIIGQTARSML